MLGGNGLQDGGPGGSAPELWIEEGTDSLQMRLVDETGFFPIVSFTNIKKTKGWHNTRDFCYDRNFR